MDKKRKGNSSCCVRLCKNVYRYVNSDIKFYKFPTAKYKADQCQKWKRWVQKTNKTPDWEPKSNTRICSSHFVGNQSSPIPTSPSYAPSIIRKHGLEIQPQEKSAIHRFNRILKRRIHHLAAENFATKSNDEKRRHNASTDTELMSQSPPVVVTEPSHFDETSIRQVEKGVQVDFGTTEEDKKLYGGTRVFICSQYVRNDVCEAQTQAYIPVKIIIPSIAKKNKCDKSCGPRLVTVEKAVGPDAPGSSECTTGFQGISSVRNDQEILDLGGVSMSTFQLLLKRLPDSKALKISKANRLFIFLTKMKTGLTFAAIGVLFRIHRTTASRIFVAVLRSLRIACDRFILWPSREIVQSTLPEEFKESYRDSRVIIDCTEMRMEQPNCVENRVFTYSHYKKGYTTKVLVGCTPGGLISFISPCYGGRTSDCQITIDSGILDLLEPGDVVLADKGFPGVQTILDDHGKGALMVMPPFLRDSQFSAEDVDTTYNIAKVRIHIERIMQRLRIYKVLDRFAIDILPHADNIVYMAAVLVNLQPPIIKNGDNTQVDDVQQKS